MTESTDTTLPKPSAQDGSTTSDLASEGDRPGGQKSATSVGQRDETGLPRTLDGLTPAMRQYVEQKRRIGDAILLFRMGDFYETFYGDAELCARVLGITLTARNKAEDPIPLAGIPFHALDGYLKKLVDAGYKVAISEQLEDPKQAKGVVKRDIVRIVTPGTLTDEALLDAGRDNVLAAVCADKDRIGIAFVELAGGHFEVVNCHEQEVLDELVRMKPAELLLPESPSDAIARVGQQLSQLCGTTLAKRSDFDFGQREAESRLFEHFGVSTLSGFGFEQMTPALRSAGAVIAYLAETQQTSVDHIVSIRQRVPSDHLLIDHSSWIALEIERTVRSGDRDGTLLAAMDRTVYPVGRRRIRQWLRQPLIDGAMLEQRYDAVQHFVHDAGGRDGLRQTLKSMADLERIAARVALHRAGPRDLAGLQRSLAILPQIAASLEETQVKLLQSYAGGLCGLDELAETLRDCMTDDPPTHTREGGFIADGFDEELDRLRGLKKDAHAWLSAYQVREAERTGLPNLKVGFNRVFGYYIELPRSAKDQVPADFVRRQTLKNAERYITDELKQYETEILSADEKALQLEQGIFDRLLRQTAEHVAALLRAAESLACLDVIMGFAHLAEDRRFVRPTISEEPCLEVEEGRHPVLDQSLGDGFVPNDTEMDDRASRVFVITGPNMAGKSTYIRQVALLTLMAQVGCFVPARRMSFSLADRIFARIGASDEIMRGHSTFMVEMTEAANILHNATSKSLVVLDEIGRGTSTFDGLALAWAMTEHLASQVKARCLIATHYHEMTELSELLEGVRNLNVAVREYPAAKDREEGVVFLHKIIPGAANKSYGIHVARLAGMPKPVVDRSREVLAELEGHLAREVQRPAMTSKKTRDDGQFLLFQNSHEELLQELKDANPDEMTPLEALARLAEWKKRFDA
ncbi:MAG: DNA mismatch repair protein MutS [Phycisphaerae bacterium]